MSAAVLFKLRATLVAAALAATGFVAAHHTPAAAQSGRMCPMGTVAVAGPGGVVTCKSMLR